MVTGDCGRCVKDNRNTKTICAQTIQLHKLFKKLTGDCGKCVKDNRNTETICAQKIQLHKLFKKLITYSNSCCLQNAERKDGDLIMLDSRTLEMDLTQNLNYLPKPKISVSKTISLTIFSMRQVAKHMRLIVILLVNHLQRGTINLQYVSSTLQITDLFTKSLPLRHFCFLVGKVLMISTFAS